MGQSFDQYCMKCYQHWEHCICGTMQTCSQCGEENIPGEYMHNHLGSMWVTGTCPVEKQKEKDRIAEHMRKLEEWRNR